MYIYLGQTDNIIKVGISSRNIRIREKEIQKYYKHNDFKMVKCIGIEGEDNIVKQIEFMVRGSIMTMQKGFTLIGDDFILCDTEEYKDFVIDMFEYIVFDIVRKYTCVDLVHSITVIPMSTIPHATFKDKVEAACKSVCE